MGDSRDLNLKKTQTLLASMKIFCAQNLLTFCSWHEQNEKPLFFFQELSMGKYLLWRGE